VGGSEEDGELKGKGEKWAVPLILNIPCHGGLLIVQACRRSLPVNLSQTQEKDGEKGIECGWVDIIYHDLSTSTRSSTLWTTGSKSASISLLLTG
jgi:hypothetical protein